MEDRILALALDYQAQAEVDDPDSWPVWEVTVAQGDDRVGIDLELGSLSYAEVRRFVAALYEAAIVAEDNDRG